MKFIKPKTAPEGAITKKIAGRSGFEPERQLLVYLFMRQAQ